MPSKKLATYALRVRTGSSDSSVSFLYVKAHSESHDGIKSGVFVSGLRVNFDQQFLSELFVVFGDVQQVVVHELETSALVVFEEESSVKKVLGTAAEGKELQVQFGEPTKPFGLKGKVEAHKAKTPGNAALQQQLDRWMEQWEVKDKQHHEAVAAAAADEGWTVVTRQRGRKKSTDQGGTAVGGVAPAVAAAALSRKAPKQLVDFYRFQARDRRRNDVVELQQQFEQDKKKIAEWRASRKFKPY